MHSAATQSALHFHVTQILIENPRQHLTTQPVGNIQHRFLSRHFAPTRHIVPFSVLGWDILILLKKIACHRETNPPLSPPFWRYAYACAMVFMTRILSFETDYPRVSRNPTRWSRGTKTLGTRLTSFVPCSSLEGFSLPLTAVVGVEDGLHSCMVKNFAAFCP